MLEKNFKMLAFVALLAVTLLVTSVNAFASTKSTPQEILSTIDNYQAQYFEIIKRHDVLLNYEDAKELKADRKELKKLYKTVKKQITNKPYMQEYKDIEKRYKKCDAITMIEINNFAESNYKEVDALLNTVYKEIKSKISKEDFNKLVLSERKWLKEISAYQKVLDSMDYGTIGTLAYYDYQTDMRQFRTLLLMLYL